MWIRGVAVVVVGLLAATGCAASATTHGSGSGECEATGYEAVRDVRYAASPGTAASLQSLDLYLPELPDGCGPVPVVVWVHGGGFRRGDKTNQVADKVRLFTGGGWAFASVDYRLVGDPRSGPAGGVYPAAEQDVASAIAFLVAHAGDHGLDAGQVMLLGHSAGAFLVALVATDGGFLAGAGPGLDLGSVACVALLDGTYDIPTMVAAGGPQADMYRAAFGEDPAVWERASPTRNVAAGAGIPPFHLVTRGSEGRVAQTRAFAARLSAAGVPATASEARGLTHADVDAAVGRPGDTAVTPELMSFFRSCGRGET
jgi:arylformamidase